MNVIDRSTAESKTIATVDRTYWVDMADALTRLESNEDFRKVILDGYFTEAAVRGVSLLARDDIKRRGERTDVMETLNAISMLEDHFHTIKALGRISEDDFEDEDDNQANSEV